MPVDHYENFPVASWLLPSRLRQPIETIYFFARTADDFADEGTLSGAERLGLLDDYRHELDLIAAGSTSTKPLFQKLAAVIAEHNLPITLFYDLLDAFSQDVNKVRYQTYAELMDYCRRSANPIGRLLLHLYRKTSPQNLSWSDAICSSLQLINHWQDVAIDYAKVKGGRIYLPQEDLASFGLSDLDIATSTDSAAWTQLMAFQCSRARDLMNSGRPLGNALPGRIGAELRTIIAGGSAILTKIDAARGDVFRHRPKLTAWDWLKIGPRALLPI
ncbi:MAG: squalene synthase HpnC [Betaproteobacteria bacterium]|nr:squalene synthase HpnC [Betaproteobacteria bacterium]